MFDIKLNISLWTLSLFRSFIDTDINFLKPVISQYNEISHIRNSAQIKLILRHDHMTDLNRINCLVHSCDKIFCSC